MYITDVFRYSEEDLQQVFIILEEVRHKWFRIGVELGLSEGELSIIKAGYPGDIHSCLRQTLKQWLHKDQFATRGMLFNVLEAIGEGELIEKLPLGMFIKAFIQLILISLSSLL